MRKFSKEYNCHYGDADQKYGGILIPLEILPLNSFFYVANGCWEGQIIENKRIFVPECNAIHSINSQNGLYLTTFNYQTFVRDFIFDKNDKLNQDWFIFEKGSSKNEIYEWFLNVITSGDVTTANLLKKFYNALVEK